MYKDFEDLKTKIENNKFKNINNLEKNDDNQEEQIFLEKIVELLITYKTIIEENLKKIGNNALLEELLDVVLYKNISVSELEELINRDYLKEEIYRQ